MFYDEEIVSDQEITEAFGNGNFGVTDYRKLLEASVLKRLVDYHCGHTITTIMFKLGLTTKNNTVTKKGKRFVAKAQDVLLQRSG